MGHKRIQKSTVKKYRQFIGKCKNFTLQYSPSIKRYIAAYKIPEINVVYNYHFDYHALEYTLKQNDRI